MSTYTPQRSNKSFCLNLWDFIPYSAYTTEQNANEFRFFHQRAEFCFHFEKNRESGKLKPNQKISLQFPLSIRLFLINFKIYLCFSSRRGKSFKGQWILTWHTFIHFQFKLGFFSRAIFFYSTIIVHSKQKVIRINFSVWWSVWLNDLL